MADIKETISTLAKRLSNSSINDIALLVSPQYTNEEYAALFEFFISKLGISSVYQWRDQTETMEDFDGLLHRGDHNSNTRGLAAALVEAGLSGEIKNHFDVVAACGAKTIIAIAPEVSSSFADLDDQLTKLEELPFVSLWTLDANVLAHKGIPHAIPMKGFAEKKGTFVNYNGVGGKLEDPFPAVSEQARDIIEVIDMLAEEMARF